VSRRHLPIIAAALVAAATWTDAATVFRCGHEYSEVACPGGTAIEVAAAPTAQQHAEARDVALSEKRLAAEMTRDRREQEASFQPSRAVSIGPTRPPAATPSAAKPKHAPKHRKSVAPDDARDFVAAAPKARKG
jgi:hypothetical protein